jgi:acyl-coenzyme A thioesterase PaaI-like protein|tara:strand:+ start:45 stop:458 length:414 start_codon:yes stop_codon:yes gene_type:complete
MSEEKKYSIPEGYELINQTEHHIRHIGDGYHKRDEDGNLIMAFWIKKENCNSADVAHGGMLMSIADYSLASASMPSRDKYVATISFRSEFIAPAKIHSLAEVHTTVTKTTKSLVFGEGKIFCAGEIVYSFSGVVKKI